MFELLGKRIKDLRNSKNISLEQAADYLGIAKRKYQLLEEGFACFGIDTITKLSCLFDVTPEDILEVLENERNIEQQIRKESDSFGEILDMLDFFYANKRFAMQISAKNSEEGY